MYISKPNRKIIKYILKKGHIPECSLPSKFQGKRINDLLKDELLQLITLVPPGEEGHEKGLRGYSVTPKGEDALRENRFNDFKTNLSIWLSVLAFIISFLVAFTPFPEWCKTLINTIGQLE